MRTRQRPAPTYGKGGDKAHGLFPRKKEGGRKGLKSAWQIERAKKKERRNMGSPCGGDGLRRPETNSAKSRVGIMQGKEDP